MRLSKRILSSSVGVVGGVLIDVGVVVSAVVLAVVVVGVRVVGLGSVTLLSVVLMFSGSGVFGSSASFGGPFGFLGVAGLFLLSWSHTGLNGRRCYRW